MGTIWSKSKEKKMFKIYQEVSESGNPFCKIAINIFDIAEVEEMKNELSKIYLRSSNSTSVYDRFIIVKCKIEDIVADINRIIYKNP